jgi:hypothetical protein
MPMVLPLAAQSRQFFKVYCIRMTGLLVVLTNYFMMIMAQVQAQAATGTSASLSGRCHWQWLRLTSGWLSRFNRFR